MKIKKGVNYEQKEESPFYADYDVDPETGMFDTEFGAEDDSNYNYTEAPIITESASFHTLIFTTTDLFLLSRLRCCISTCNLKTTTSSIIVHMGVRTDMDNVTPLIPNKVRYFYRKDYTR